MGQTVNLLVFTFGGSNPSVPTSLKDESIDKSTSNEVAEVAQLIEH